MPHKNENFNSDLQLSLDVITSNSGTKPTQLKKPKPNECWDRPTNIAETITNK